MVTLPIILSIKVQASKGIIQNKEKGTIPIIPRCQIKSILDLSIFW